MTPEERRALVEAPLPAITIRHAPSCHWGGTTRYTNFWHRTPQRLTELDTGLNDNNDNPEED